MEINPPLIGVEPMTARKANTLPSDMNLFFSHNSQGRCNIHKKQKLAQPTQETKGEIVAR